MGLCPGAEGFCDLFLVGRGGVNRDLAGGDIDPSKAGSVGGVGVPALEAEAIPRGDGDVGHAMDFRGVEGGASSRCCEDHMVCGSTWLPGGWLEIGRTRHGVGKT